MVGAARGPAVAYTVATRLGRPEMSERRPLFVERRFPAPDLFSVDRPSKRLGCVVVRPASTTKSRPCHVCFAFLSRGLMTVSVASW